MFNAKIECILNSPVQTFFCCTLVHMLYLLRSNNTSNTKDGLCLSHFLKVLLRDVLKECIECLLSLSSQPNLKLRRKQRNEIVKVHAI